jgi:hypothetical protein
MQSGAWPADSIWLFRCDPSAAVASVVHPSERLCPLARPPASPYDWAGPIDLFVCSDADRTRTAVYLLNRQTGAFHCFDAHAVRWRIATAAAAASAQSDGSPPAKRPKISPDSTASAAAAADHKWGGGPASASASASASVIGSESEATEWVCDLPFVSLPQEPRGGWALPVLVRGRHRANGRDALYALAHGQSESDSAVDRAVYCFELSADTTTAATCRWTAVCTTPSHLATARRTAVWKHWIFLLPERPSDFGDAQPISRRLDTRTGQWFEWALDKDADGRARERRLFDENERADGMTVVVGDWLYLIGGGLESRDDRSCFGVSALRLFEDEKHMREAEWEYCRSHLNVPEGRFPTPFLHGSAVLDAWTLPHRVLVLAPGHFACRYELACTYAGTATAEEGGGLSCRCLHAHSPPIGLTIANVPWKQLPVQVLSTLRCFVRAYLG